MDEQKDRGRSGRREEEEKKRKKNDTIFDKMRKIKIMEKSEERKKKEICVKI